ncbi:hypothetical protein SKAU_G00115410 [Synaphobranchus kaupii]|uniref:HAT C-terminal dimerisation domain-containing protein n=1 Tax=Synaphobranchus kaupii TaxID=118154 RepID=A0A9Q1FMI0_SYNKA|nr:hypothetical protein SKAU_G00115410 [Synaphobranchus kaupii]
MANDAYVTVTAHYIDDEWEMKDVVLKTTEITTDHKAENVAACIGEILDEYSIKREAVIAVTTDNASNYINAVEKHLGAVSVPCVAHTINLAVQKGLAVKAIGTPISRLKATALHFNKSTTDSYRLENKQMQLEVKPAKLINDCPTRWNSTYDMVCRAAEQQVPVAAVIMDKKLAHLELSTNEWTVMEKVCDVLKPFKVATEALSTDTYPTASAVLPLQHILVSQLNQPTTDDPNAIKEMKSKIVTDLAKRYNEEKRAFLLLNTASYLDPRFSRLIHLTEDQKNKVREKIVDELTTEEGESEIESTSENRPSHEPRTGRRTALDALGDLFGDSYCSSTGMTTQTTLIVQQEMAMYEREAPLPADSNPLQWWKTSGSVRYHHLAQLAHRYLCIPGTSVRSERVFSTAGNIVNKKRSALDPENVDRLVFLANNL